MKEQTTVNGKMVFSFQKKSQRPRTKPTLPAWKKPRLPKRQRSARKRICSKSSSPHPPDRPPIVTVTVESVVDEEVLLGEHAVGVGVEKVHLGDGVPLVVALQEEAVEQVRTEQMELTLAMRPLSRV